MNAGDIIKCHDIDDLVHTMQSLENEDIHTDFLYEHNGIKGYYLEVIKIDD